MSSLEQDREISVGDAVVYHDPVGKPHSAIVQAVWSKNCINVVIVSGDKNKQDSYGRQIEHLTSLCHKSSFIAHGNYWRFSDEEPNPIVQPAQA